jgi:hypothetical protein
LRVELGVLQTDSNADCRYCIKRANELGRIVFEADKFCQ